MAAFCKEKKVSYDTLTSLKSTSKGKLRYDGDWQINEELSKKLSCSFESFLSESTPDSFMGINSGMFASSLEDKNQNTSSENEAERSLRSDTAEKTNNPFGIARNFDIENELSFKQYQKKCRENTEQRKQERARILERRVENLKKDNEQILRDCHDDLAKKKRRFEQEIMEMKQQGMEEFQRRKIEMDKQAKEHKRKLDEIYTRSLIEESHMAREKEERRSVLENLKKNIISHHRQVSRNIDTIQQRFNDSKHMSFVEAQVYEDVTSVLSEIIAKAEAIVTRCATFKGLSDAEGHLEVMNKLIQETLSIYNKVTDILATAQEKAAAAAAKKKEIEQATRIRHEKEIEEKQKKLENEKKLSEKRSEPKSNTLPTVVDLESNKSDKKTPERKFAQFISENMLREYIELQEYLTAIEASFKDFISDPNYSKYKFDLQKAINTPINALSSHSPSQLNDKIYRLVTVLSGNNVEVGGKRVSCNSHPRAMVFCKHLVAKKLVMQGAQQVSSNPSSAFLYAAVIVGIWSAFPDVGKLILAHFHRSYPYLVPYYMPQVEGQSNDDYHKALGYSVGNGKIEDENHFLKKFSGTVQLYAAVISSKGATQPDHPHGIDKGWTWLARVLNLKPHPSITATMLFEFIKVAGHLLIQRYRKQFQKLLLMLCKDFIPAIEKVTPADKQGPLQRFKDFLYDCIKTHRISLPKGYLTDRWWQTGHF